MNHKLLAHLSCVKCGKGTFDMYSPAHDHPRSEDTVREWFKEIDFEQAHVGRGPNGVVGRGVRPAA